MLRYIPSAILNVLFTYLIAYPLSPILPLFCRADGYLPNWLKYFQTQDAPLDAGWKDGYFPFVGTPTGWALYYLRMQWLWRNPAYGFCYWPLGLSYVPTDWVIDALTKDAAGNLTLFKAHTKDGKHFSHTEVGGLKLGFKLWWALNADDTLIDKLPLSRGPDNRLPTAFTPKL